MDAAHKTTETIDVAPFDFGLGDVNLDLSAFDLGDISGPQNENRYVKPKLYHPVRSTAVKYDRAADLVNDFGPAMLMGERVDALVSGNFIFGDFFEALAVEADLKIDDLTLSTLSISQENVDSLRNMMQGDYLQNLNMIVSDYFWSHNRHNAAYIYDALDIDNRFQLAVASVHTKIALMLIKGRKFVIHGSANFRSSRSIEAFTVETNPDLYDFHMGWKLAILEKYGTVKKSIRAGAAYDIIKKVEWK